MKILVLLVALTVVGIATAKPTDPRVCVYHSQAQCGREAAITALRRAMSQKTGTTGLMWDAANLYCRPYAGFLRYGCSWGTATTAHGSALVVFALHTWKPTVTVRANVCAAPGGTPGATPEPQGCTAILPR